MGNQYTTNLNTIPTNYDMNETKFYAVNVKLLDDLIKTCLKTDGSSFMQASLDMNEENIEYLKNPNLAHHRVNKSYVDGHLQDYLRLDGTRPMANDLSIGQCRVVRDNLHCFTIDSHGDLQMEADIDLNHHVINDTHGNKVLWMEGNSLMIGRENHQLTLNLNFNVKNIIIVSII